MPENARWSNIRTHAQSDDIKVRLDDILEELEKTYPEKLKGLLPRIYAGSNLDSRSFVLRRRNWRTRCFRSATT